MKLTLSQTLRGLLVLGVAIMIACSKKEDPKPSTETKTDTKTVSAEQKKDVQTATQSAAKATDARKTATDATEKVNSVKGGRLAALRKARQARQDTLLPGDPGFDTTGFGGGPGFDTTGQGGGPGFDTTGLGGGPGTDTSGFGDISLDEIFTDKVLGELESELEKELGGSVMFKIADGKMSMTIDYGTGSPNPLYTKTGEGIAKTLKGKMSFEIGFDLTAAEDAGSEANIKFENYEEIYDDSEAGLNTKMNGTMKNTDSFSANGFSTISDMDLTITDSSGSVTLKGVATVTGTGLKLTENSNYTITVGTETFKFISENIEFDFSCTASLGNAIKGKATIELTVDGATVKAVIDYGDGTCDAKATIAVDGAAAEDFPLDDNSADLGGDDEFPTDTTGVDTSAVLLKK